MPRFSATVVDHFTNPRNCGEIADADVRAFIGNPVCGDQILLTARISDDTITEIQFQAYGCSASLAVASLLTTAVEGTGLDSVSELDAARIEDLAGGFAPDQRHVAALCADVAHRLVDNYRRGINDEGLASCDL